METILLLLKIVPTLIDAIVAIEKQIVGANFGSQKLNAVRGILNAIDTGYNKYWSQIAGIITTLVSLFNATGVFQSTKPVAPINATPINATPAINPSPLA